MRRNIGRATLVIILTRSLRSANHCKFILIENLLHLLSLMKIPGETIRIRMEIARLFDTVIQFGWFIIAPLCGLDSKEISSFHWKQIVRGEAFSFPVYPYDAASAGPRRPNSSLRHVLSLGSLEISVIPPPKSWNIRKRSSDHFVCWLGIPGNLGEVNCFKENKKMRAGKRYYDVEAAIVAMVHGKRFNATAVTVVLCCHNIALHF